MLAKLFLSFSVFFCLFFSVNISLSQKMTDKDYADSVYNSMDYSNSVVRDLAVKLAKKAGGIYNIKQICYIWDYLKKNWSYVSDPSNSEYIAKASESADLLAGDCDDFAVLLAALLKDIGGTPRIILAWNSTGGHAFTEIFATNDFKKLKKLFENIQNFYNWKNLHKGKKYTLYYEKTKQGYWINLDWNSKYVGDSPIFNYTKRIIISDDGTYTIENK